MSAAPDVVYMWGGRGRSAEALRYSLRSLRNVPHGRVWITGAEPPDWVAGVEYIPVVQPPDKHRATTENLRAACAHPEVSAAFLRFDSDFFLMKPGVRIEPMHRGLVTEVLRKLHGADLVWMAGLRRSLAFYRARGIENPLCYELHAPQEIEKQKMANLLAAPDFIGHDIHKRSIYGNVYTTGGTRLLDPKVHSQRGGFDPGAPYLSTSRWFPNSDVCRHIATTFSEPCEFEATTMAS